MPDENLLHPNPNLPLRPFPTPCECARPGWCNRHHCEKTPQWFHLCRSRDDYFELWEAGAGPGQQQLPNSPGRLRCVHRGSIPLREVDCDLCGGRSVRLPVFTCGLLGECTERRYGTRSHEAREMPACLSCDKYLPDDEPLA